MDEEILELIKAVEKTTTIALSDEGRVKHFRAVGAPLRILFERRACADMFWKRFSESCYPPAKSRRATHTSPFEFWLKMEKVVKKFENGEIDLVSNIHCEKLMFLCDRLIYEAVTERESATARRERAKMLE